MSLPPIILHHGIFGFGQIQLGKLHLCYFRGIDRALVERGHRVAVARVHPTGSIARRARQLKQVILQQLPAGSPKAIIIAHSMGGLDARYMIAKLGMAERVAALVSVATPHRGSPYANWCVENLGRRLGAFKLMRLLKLDMEGASDLTTSACRRFNDEVADVPGVRYYSISAARPWWAMPPVVYHSWKIINEAEGDNDGMVSVASARWGEHLETWPADHLTAINRQMVPRPLHAAGDVCARYLELVSKVGGA